MGSNAGIRLYDRIWRESIPFDRCLFGCGRYIDLLVIQRRDCNFWHDCVINIKVQSIIVVKYLTSYALLIREPFGYTISQNTPLNETMHPSTILDADLARAKSYDTENAVVELQQEDEHHNALFNDRSLVRPISCPATCELCGQWIPKHTVRSFFIILFYFIFV